MSDAINSATGPAWPSERARIEAAADRATVVWDFDGVIADTEPLHAESYRRLLERRGYEPDADFFDALIGHTEPEIWSMLRESGAPVAPDIESLVEERREEFLELALGSLEPSWLAKDLIQRLDGVADRQLIVSNGDPATIEVLLLNWGLSELLELPAGEGVPKRDRLAKLWDAGPSVTIEDNGGYLAQAREAGSFCVAVLHGMSQEPHPVGDVEVRI